MFTQILLTRHFSYTRQIGIIAQELEKIYPELVSLDDQGYKTVNYTGLVPVLIESVKELNHELLRKDEDLKVMMRNIAKQATEMDELRKEFVELKRQIRNAKSDK